MHVEAICDLYPEKEPGTHGPERSPVQRKGNQTQPSCTLLFL